MKQYGGIVSFQVADILWTHAEVVFVQWAYIRGSKLYLRY